MALSATAPGIGARCPVASKRDALSAVVRKMRDHFRNRDELERFDFEGWMEEAGLYGEHMATEQDASNNPLAALTVGGTIVYGLTPLGREALAEEKTDVHG